MYLVFEFANALCARFMIQCKPFSTEGREPPFEQACLLSAFEASSTVLEMRAYAHSYISSVYNTKTDKNADCVPTKQPTFFIDRGARQEAETPINPQRDLFPYTGRYLASGQHFLQTYMLSSNVSFKYT